MRHSSWNHPLLPLVEWGLATWRLSRMLVKEQGPYHIFERLRRATGIEYESGDVLSYPDWNPLHCVYCTSVWVALVLGLAPRWLRASLAASGIAALLEQVKWRV